MIEVGVTELDVNIVNDWVKVAILIKYQISLEVDVEVFEDELNWALTWQEHRIDGLRTIDLPVLDGWEVNLDERNVVASGQLNDNVFDIEVYLGVRNVSPGDIIGERGEKQTRLIVKFLGKVDVHIHKVGQELLHGLLEGID